MENRLKSDIEAEHRLFECMVTDDCSFGIAVATMPDDFIIRLHDYLLKQERKQILSPEKDEQRLERLQSMTSKLEDIEVVQDHMEQKRKQLEDRNNNIQLIVEKKKIKKILPFHKLADNFRKNRK